MIVVVGGMYRSGSTFAFNVVRECLAARGGVVTHAANAIDPAYLADSPRNLILKSHAPDAFCTRLITAGAVRCVCTIRKPEDAIASWMRAFGHGVDQSIELMRGWLAWHREVSSYTLNMTYEEVDRRPLRSVFRLQRWLFGRCDPLGALHLRREYDKRRLKEQYDKLERDGNVRDIGFSYYDSTTFFHRRHISSLESQPGSALLGRAELTRVRAALAPYVDGHGVYRP